MKKALLQIAKFSYFFICFFMLLGMHAKAYIDPSAVTYIIQAVAGVLIAGGAALTIFRHKIFKRFKGDKKNEGEAEETIEFKDEEK